MDNLTLAGELLATTHKRVCRDDKFISFTIPLSLSKQKFRLVFAPNASLNDCFSATL